MIAGRSRAVTVRVLGVGFARVGGHPLEGRRDVSRSSSDSGGSQRVGEVGGDGGKGTVSVLGLTFGVETAGPERLDLLRSLVGLGEGPSHLVEGGDTSVAVTMKAKKTRRGQLNRNEHVERTRR